MISRSSPHGSWRSLDFVRVRPVSGPSCDGHEVITCSDVRRAAEEQLYRVNRIEERMQELFDDGTIMVDTDGAVVGQINGLSVISLGDHVFGRPSRITAPGSGLGQAGMVNVEREVKASGPIHDKGVLT